VIERRQALWVIYLSLGVALMTMLLPLPMEWRILRPDFVALALFYWVLALPHRVGVTTAFSVGLAQDLIEGAPIGISSLGLMLATLVLLFSYQRVRQFDGLQQSLVMLALMVLSSGIEGWFRTGVDLPTLPLTGLLGFAMSMLCWVPTRHVCRQLRRHYGVV
jgi:rod shape-determining protein MreD